MSSKLKKWLIIGSVIIGLIAIYLLVLNMLRGGAFPGVIDGWNRMVFSKTVDDFPEHMIDNLDDQKDSNFIVYAKGVKRITAENAKNQVVTVDNENLEYVFADPDEQITSLKRGDVFFMEPNEHYAQGLSVKVKKVKIKDGQAVVSGKNVRLNDLIAYADVDMEIPITQFYLHGSEMGDDVQVEWAARNDFTESQLLASATVTALDPVVQNSVAATPKTTELPYWLYDKPIGEFNVKGISISTGINFDWDALHANGRGGMNISTLHVTFKFRPLLLSLVVGTEVNGSAFLNGEIYGATGGQIPIKLPTIVLPVAGPLVFTYTPSVSIDLAARIGMNTEISADTTFEAEVNYSPIIRTAIRSADFQIQNPTHHVNMKEMKGNVSLNILKGTATFGIPYVTTIYKSLNGGITMEGTVQEQPVVDVTALKSDSYHECKFCVDGDVYLHTKMDVGLALDLLNLFHKTKNKPTKAGGVVDFDGAVSEDGQTATMTTEDGNIYQFGDSKSFRIMDWSFSIVDLKWKFPIPEYQNFYFSIRENQDPSFGWGECPFTRWRTEITAKNSFGIPMDDVVVTANYPDGRTERVVADSGKTVLYLPNGTNHISCEKNVLADQSDVHIDSAPQKVKFTLKDDSELIVICDFYKVKYDGKTSWNEPQPLETYPEVISAIQERYPEAKIISGMDLDGKLRHNLANFVQSDVERLGLSKGDVIVVVDLFDANSKRDLYIDSVLYQPLIDGISYYEFGVGIVLGTPGEWGYGGDPQIIRYYQNYLQRTSYEYREDILIGDRYHQVTDYITGHGANVYEHIPVGPLMDEDYQVLNDRSADDYMEYELTEAIGKMYSVDYYSNLHEYDARYTDYGLNLLFPYIDEVWTKKQ